MSPNVGNFVHDLVEMAKAMETLPQVEAERDRLNASLNETLVVVQNRELSIIELKAQIETLQARVRETEASRDDAELRFLEADEQHAKLERSFQTALEAMDATDRLIQSFKPKPMPEPAAQPPSQGQPIVGNGNGDPQPQAPEQTLAATDTASSQGQGEVDPTANSLPNTSSMGNQEGSSQIVEIATAQPQDAVFTMVKSSGPYGGLRYYDHPTYVPFNQWLEGGGSEEDYNWRPAPVGQRSNW